MLKHAYESLTLFGLHTASAGFSGLALENLLAL